MNINYKIGKKEEIESMGKLYMKAFNREPWNDSWTVESAEKRLIMFLEDKNCRSIVAEDEMGNIVGVLIGRKEHFFDGDHFQIIELFVDMDIKGKGLGSNLLRTLEKELIKENIKRIYLLTLRTNETRGFYKKNGFNEAKELIIMEK